MISLIKGPKQLGVFAPVSGRPGSSDFQKTLVSNDSQFESAKDTPLSRQLAMISQREGEDAALTGGTRSLHRRLLALNFHELPPAASPRSAHTPSLPKTLSA